MWRNHFHLKDSPVAIGEDFPTHIQDIRRKVLVPALQKIKKENPRAKASVIENRLMVNGKRYFHYDVLKEWLPTIIPTVLMIQESIRSPKEKTTTKKPYASSAFDLLGRSHVIIRTDFVCKTL